MQYALGLAAKGSEFVAPNPMVGAVIVAFDTIIGEGYHERFGSAHAEVNALASVKQEHLDLIKDATLYVTLEPCNHFGKTPPCTEKVIEAGFKKVVIGTADPNPVVNGAGIKRLLEAGVEVEVGVLETECRDLNKHFFCFYEKQRPYITLKWAQTLTGFIGTHDHKPIHITNAHSDALVHKWRATHMGILVGGKTVITDNPKLTNRLWTGNNPIRIVIDTHGSLPADANIFNAEAATIVFNFMLDAQAKNVAFVKIENNQNILTQILNNLFVRNINSVLVEGGTITLQHFIDANLWDEINYFETGHHLQHGVLGPNIPEGEWEETTIMGDKLYTVKQPL
jgi:diaminohydroxyphosphoribosylaminopyrimidine deaminase / 5-amino-6-(5-phosphoribosylamino)uracil reductase